MLFPHFSFISDRRKLCLHDIIKEFLDGNITETTSAVMLLKLLKAAVFGQKFGEMLLRGKCVKVNEHRVALSVSMILLTQMSRVSKHGHNFFLDLLRLIREIDAVSQGFAHFCFTVYSRQPQASLV